VAVMLGEIHNVNIILMPTTAHVDHCFGVMLGGIYILSMILMAITASVHPWLVVIFLCKLCS
jgi:hypothetical protein